MPCPCCAHAVPVPQKVSTASTISRHLHDSIAMISISRESAIFFQFFSYLYRIEVTIFFQFRIRIVLRWPIFFNFFRIGLDIDDIGVGQYRRHIGVGDIDIPNIEVVSTYIDPKKSPKNGQKLPKFAKNGQKLPKNAQNIAKISPKYRKIGQKLPFFGVSVSYWSSKKIFSCRIDIGSDFWPKNDSCIDIGLNFWPKNDSCIDIGLDFWAKNDSCIDIGSIFWAKNLGYRYRIEVLKIWNAELWCRRKGTLTEIITTCYSSQR